MVSRKRRDAEADGRAARVHSRLAEARQSRGVAAVALARVAGVTRQTIYAIEAGTYVPNTAIALKLARALEMPVEDLFQLDVEPPAPRLVAARLIGGEECCRGTPVQLCKVGEKWVGVPAVAAPWQLPPADAVLADPARGLVQRLAEDNREPRLLVAGCDPAVSVLSRHQRFFSNESARPHIMATMNALSYSGFAPRVDGAPLARFLLDFCIAGRCGHVFDLLVRRS